jgi:carboxypeptidase C (cathepsin A)
MSSVVQFAQADYAKALAAFPNPDPAAVQRLSDYTGIAPMVLTSWEGLNVSDSDNRGRLRFLTKLLRDEGKELGAYDGRVAGIGTGIVADIDPLSGGNDPTMTAVNGAYTAMWNTYLEDGLGFTCASSFTDLNDQVFKNWDFGHIDPTGAQKGKDVNGNIVLYTAGDLAATMALNVDLKVLSVNGYFDSVTPFSQTTMDLENMPLTDPSVRKNLTVRYYPSGHMVYLDGNSRTALKAELAAFYASTVSDRPAVERIRGLQSVRREHLRPT